MRCTLVLLALASAVFALPSLDLRAPFYEFKVKHEKVYKDIAEENFRFKIFSENLEKIKKHNALYEAGLKSYKLGVTKFADLTQEEFKKYLSLSGPMPNLPNLSIYEPPVGAQLPDSVDYRKQNAVNPIKDQGGCGSCWAFSTVGALETINFLKSGKLLSLSEQNLVDCSGSYGNFGCGGGWMDWAYNYIQDNGIETEQDYPYTGEDGTCKFQKSKSAVSITGHVMIKTGSESDLQSAVANVGPVAVAVDASEWQLYSGGIFETTDFYGLDHGVVAIGYGSESGKDYWIIRNSWGSSWGESGYIRVARNKNNQIGITNRACYPTL